MLQDHLLSDYLAKIKERLKANGFKISENVISDNYVFKLVAQRRRFQIEHLGLAETFFIFAVHHSPDIYSLEEFFKRCFRYARKSKISPLPYTPLLDIAVCFPVAIVDRIDPVTLKHIRNTNPPWHFADYELDAVCDLDTNQLYYSEKTPHWAMMLWDYFRKQAQEMLSP